MPLHVVLLQRMAAIERSAREEGQHVATPTQQQDAAATSSSLAAAAVRCLSVLPLACAYRQTFCPLLCCILSLLPLPTMLPFPRAAVPPCQVPPPCPAPTSLRRPSRTNAPSALQAGQQTSDSGITHSIVISGNPLTMEIGEDDQVVWQYSGEGAGDSRDSGRDAQKLPNGNYLVTLNDKVVEVRPGKDPAFAFCLHCFRD